MASTSVTALMETEAYWPGSSPPAGLGNWARAWMGAGSGVHLGVDKGDPADVRELFAFQQLHDGICIPNGRPGPFFGLQAFGHTHFRAGNGKIDVHGVGLIDGGQRRAGADQVAFGHRLAGRVAGNGGYHLGVTELNLSLLHRCLGRFHLGPARCRRRPGRCRDLAG